MTFTIDLENYPDYMIPYIRPIIVFKTEDAYLNNLDNYDFYYDLQYTFEKVETEASKFKYVLKAEVQGWFGLEVNNDLPLFVKLLVYIDNPKKKYEIRTNKV